MPFVRMTEGLWPRSGRVRVAVWGHDGLRSLGAEEPLSRQKSRFGRSPSYERRVELDRWRPRMLLAASRSAVIPIVYHSQALREGEDREVAEETQVAPAQSLTRVAPRDFGAMARR